MQSNAPQLAYKWSALERFATQGFQFFFIIILARLLEPELFGLVGILAVFISLSQIFIDFGFSSALIQKGNPTRDDLNTVFYINIILGLGVYCTLFLLAPYIAIFYEQPVLEILTKVVALNSIVNSLGIVQRVLLTIQLDFKTQAFCSIWSVVISGVVGCFMAYYGAGVWAIVTQSLLCNILTVTFLWCLSNWKPEFIFSNKSLKNMYDFGSKLLVAGILDIIFNNMYVLVIAKYFSITQAGYFTQSIKLTETPALVFSGLVKRVNFPQLSRIRTKKKLLGYVLNRTIKMTALIFFPIMIFISFFSQEIIVVVLGENWLQMSNYLTILALSVILVPINAINLNLLQAQGRSDLFLKLEVYKKILVTIVLILSIPFGVFGVCLGMLFVSILSFFINSFYSYLFSGYGIIKQLKVLVPILLFCILMGLITTYICGFIHNDPLKILCGIVCYFCFTVQAIKSLYKNEFHFLRTAIKFN
jgi:teichuronic acid exporter